MKQQKDDTGRTQWDRAMSRRAREGGKLAGPLVPSSGKTTPTNVRRHGG